MTVEYDEEEVDRWVEVVSEMCGAVCGAVCGVEVGFSGWALCNLLAAKHSLCVGVDSQCTLHFLTALCLFVWTHMLCAPSLQLARTVHSPQSLHCVTPHPTPHPTPRPRPHTNTNTEKQNRFIALADAIEEAFPNIVVEGNPSGPGRPGAFEVTGANGALLFSKLSSGGWPQAEVVVDAVGAAAAACSLPAQQQ